MNYLTSSSFCMKYPISTLNYHAVLANGLRDPEYALIASDLEKGFRFSYDSDDMDIDELVDEFSTSNRYFGDTKSLSILFNPPIKHYFHTVHCECCFH